MLEWQTNLWMVMVNFLSSHKFLSSACNFLWPHCRPKDVVARQVPDAQLAQSPLAIFPAIRMLLDVLTLLNTVPDFGHLLIVKETADQYESSDKSYYHFIYISLSVELPILFIVLAYFWCDRKSSTLRHLILWLHLVRPLEESEIHWVPLIWSSDIRSFRFYGQYFHPIYGPKWNLYKRFFRKYGHFGFMLNFYLVPTWTIYPGPSVLLC